MTEQTFLTMRETCARLGVTRQTVLNLVKRAKLTRHTREIGGGGSLPRVVFDTAEVDALGTFTPAAVETGKNAQKRAKARKKSASKAAK